ncbi:MAG: APC family permease [Candidatus Levyibacteriota bacterium]
MSQTNPGKIKEHARLGQWFATAICGNDILSSTFYVSGIAIVYAGVFAPIVLALIGVVLFLYKAVYTEVVEALPTNGGAYNCLLNATSKNIAAVAGTTTVLSYIATAVISGQSAISYLHSIVNIPVIPITIGLLFLFAMLVISGIKDSARVAFSIFSFHVLVLIAFVILGGVYFLRGGHSYLMENVTATIPIMQRLGGLLPALFFGFAASLLGVSGFESSANFVEEQRRGVFRKTLRNMLIGVAIFNPLIALICLNVIPFDTIIKARDFLLSDTALMMGGSIFRLIVVIDAILVLAGAVLTAYVGVSGLLYRMTTDDVFPPILAKQNKKGSHPYIVILFFLLCTSILILTKGDLLSLAGVYTIAFLSVMTLFALGNLIMRETRRELKRTYNAPLLFVIFAFIATASGIIGNIKVDPRNFVYFATYFIPAIILVFATIYLDYIILFIMRFTTRFPKLHTFLQKEYYDLTNDGKFVVFFHHLKRLHTIFEYIDRNEIGRTVYLVHCNNKEKARPQRNIEKFEELKKILPILKRAGVYAEFHILPVFINKPFGPQVIDEVAKKYNVRKNRVLIGSIHEEHQFDYEDLGGVRIIF